MQQGRDGRKKKAQIRSTIRMLIPLDKQREAFEILSSLGKDTQLDPTCISYRLYRGVNEVRAIMVEELWENDAAVLRHLKSDTYRRVLLVVEMAEQPPEIRFDTITSTSGIETIKNARIKT